MDGRGGVAIAIAVHVERARRYRIVISELYKSEHIPKCYSGAFNDIKMPIIWSFLSTKRST